MNSPDNAVYSAIASGSTIATAITPTPAHVAATVAPTAAAAAAAAPERIRRNTACTGCRDSKVKCNASKTGNNSPCLRCAKLGIACVVDKSHKRSTRRSKLEQLERELNNIKDVVKTTMSEPVLQHNRNAAGSPGSPAFSRPPASGAFPSTMHDTLVGKVSDPATASIHISSPVPGSVSASASTPLTPASEKRPAGSPRALGNRVFTRADIDHYFDKYFEHFHQYFPVVRIRDPDKTYAESPLLFWTIICVVSRRYARDSTTFTFLIETLPREIWPVLASHPVPIASINALLLLSSWPLPTVRLMTDPSFTYAGIAMNSSLLLGLHTMQGCHPHFCFGYRKTNTTDEEAAYTWAGCNIVMQRVSSISGCPSNFALFNEALRKTSYLDESPYFKNLLAAQGLSNRVSKTMFAALEQAGKVSEAAIWVLESDIDSLGALWTSGNDVDTLTLLCTRLDIQSYYFVPKPDPASSTLRQNMLRAYSTANSLIELAMSLEASSQFLQHAPYYIFRYVLDATCVIMRVSLTNLKTHLDPAAVAASIKRCCSALRICSVQENDLSMRTLKIMESFWSLQHVMPVQDPISQLCQRIGSPLTFDSLRRWKLLLEGLQRESQSKPPGMPIVVAKPPLDDHPPLALSALVMQPSAPDNLLSVSSLLRHSQDGALGQQFAQQQALPQLRASGFSPGMPFGQGSTADHSGTLISQPGFPGGQVEQLQDIDWDSLMRDLDWGDMADPAFLMS